MRHYPANRAKVLRNETCVYCGSVLTDVTRTKEHVIGRKFVPKGKLEAQWNLIAFACSKCNGLKADLEDDISSITLQPSLMGEAGHIDKTIIERALERAKRSISRRTGKPVAESQEEMKINVQLMPGVNMTFSFTAPAQSEDHSLFELARHHLVGFFYFLTYDENARRGYWWPGGFQPITHVSRLDWGNPLVTGFAAAVVTWEPRLMLSTADGFFKCSIRRHPFADCWSWALEWNHNSRLIGFFGDRDAGQAVFNTLPQPSMEEMKGQGDDHLRFRTETPLGNNDRDLLFFWDDRGDPTTG